MAEEYQRRQIINDKKLMKIDQLNELPKLMVGDGKSPNVFFVTLGSNVQLVSLRWRPAYDLWRSFAEERPNEESMLEDRLYGVICQRGIFTDTKPGRFQTIDDSRNFIKEMLPL